MLPYFILAIVILVILVVTEEGRTILERIIIITTVGGLIFLVLWAVGGDGFLNNEILKSLIPLLPALVGATGAIAAFYSVVKTLARRAANKNNEEETPNLEKIKPQPKIESADDDISYNIDDEIKRIGRTEVSNPGKIKPIAENKNEAEEIKENETTNFSDWEKIEPREEKEITVSLPKENAITELFDELKKLMPRPEAKVITGKTENTEIWNPEKTNTIFKKYKGNYIVWGLVLTLFLLQLIFIISLFF